MSVTNQNPVNAFTANGVTTVFNFTFLVLESSDLNVQVDGVDKTIGTEYTVSGLGNQAGGSVTFVSAPASSASVVIFRDSVLERDTDYQNNGDLRATTFNNDLDRIWLALQELSYEIQLALTLRPGSPLNGTITLPDPGASSVIGWNANGTQIALYPLDDFGVGTGAQLRADIATSSANKGASLVAFYDNIAPAYLKTLSDIANGNEVSLFRFIDPAKHAGIRAFTNNDDLLTSFANAFAAARCLFLPYGGYHVSDNVGVSIQGFSLRGEGRVASQIISTANNKAILTIASGLSAVTLRDFCLDRNITAISGGDGLVATNTIGQATIENLRVIRQFRGVVLGPTDFSEFRNSRVEYCQAIGVYMSNTAGDGACQWQLDTILSQMNGAQGFMLQTVAGPAGVTPGTWTNLATFSNTGVGIAVVGSAGVPVNDVRINGAFLGNDANSELYLDSYGGSHVFTSVFAELAGRGPTGPTLSTAASGVGSGFETTSNNIDAQFSNCHAVANSFDGYYFAGVNETLGNCTAKNNGLQATAGRRNGVYNVSGRSVINGGFYGNTGGGTTQQYGAFAANGNNVAVVGADLTGNSTAPTGATSNATYITQIGNLPNTTNVGLAPQGSVLVGGGATGGFPAAGVINVAGGLLKNNTAYSNP